VATCTSSRNRSIRRLVEVVDAGIADGGEDAAEVGVGREEGGLDQRRVGDGVADRLALGGVAAAFDLDGDELGGAFAVAHDGLGQFGATEVTASASRRPSALSSDSISALPAVPEAISMKESLVEVSPSTVMQLKLRSAASRTRACAARLRHGGIGGHEAEHGGHVRRIMPAPLAMPVTVTVRRRD
jgi:hypothetical protein